METIVQILLLLSFAAVLRAEVVMYDKCNNHDDLNCNVSQVRVTPCAEAAQNKPCHIKKGKSAKIEFDYEPGGNYDDLTTMAYWASPAGDLPWIGMDAHGCNYTECPTAPHQETFSYNLKIPSKIMVRQYDVKWRLWKEDAMQCCFLVKIKVVK